MTTREALVAFQFGAPDAALLDRSPSDVERPATETLLGAVAVVVGEGSAVRDVSTEALASGFARDAVEAQGREAVLWAGLAPATLPQRETVLR